MVGLLAFSVICSPRLRSTDDFLSRANLFFASLLSSPLTRTRIHFFLFFFFFFSPSLCFVFFAYVDSFFLSSLLTTTSLVYQKNISIPFLSLSLSLVWHRHKITFAIYRRVVFLRLDCRRRSFRQYIYRYIQT